MQWTKPNYNKLITWVSDTRFLFDGGLWETRAGNRNKPFKSLIPSSRCVEGKVHKNVLSYLFIYEVDGKKDFVITNDKHWKKHKTTFSVARKRYDLLYLVTTENFKELLK